MCAYLCLQTFINKLFMLFMFLYILFIFKTSKYSARTDAYTQNFFVSCPLSTLYYFYFILHSPLFLFLFFITYVYFSFFLLFFASYLKLLFSPFFSLFFFFPQTLKQLLLCLQFYFQLSPPWKMTQHKD